MPELPEVETTVRGLDKVLVGKTITGIWSDYPLPVHIHKNHLKSPKHFKKFRDIVVGKKVLSVQRRGKNILINLVGNYTVLVHMKMTGHFLYGPYQQKNGTWKTIQKTGPLTDPFNQFIRLVFSLSDKKHLAFSDLRKFAKVMVSETNHIDEEGEIIKIGPEPLEKSFSVKKFKERLLIKPNGKIKQVLMDQSVVAGIGNIYSDEILWETGLHPTEPVKNIPEVLIEKMYGATGKILRYALTVGGDSDSDYRNVYGERGQYQNLHKAYHQTGTPCRKPKCNGTILRIKLGGRSAHFCSVHQKLQKARKNVS